VLKTLCGYDASKLRSFQARFSAPVMPGESIFVEMWRRGQEVSFRAWVKARNAKVLDNGRAIIAG
jgi:hypothetical protein